jgi:hypothetical protein
VVGDQTVSLERMRDRSCAGVRPSSARVRVELPTPPASLVAGIAALTDGRVTDGVRLLAGLGEGLTPAGDDVLAGYAAARLGLGAPVAMAPMAAARASPLGLAYLRCAERGELPDALGSWGATSGVGLAWGINAAISSLTERVRAGVGN